MNRRNRYYDPNTGQFTQEDPIGLAGGVNLYGFANGDPVNLSDPFGLCPDDESGRRVICIAFFIMAESRLGLKGDNRDFSLDSDPSQSRAFIIIDLDNQAVTSQVNESCKTNGECKPALSNNEINVSFNGDGSFSVGFDLKNSVISLSPSIDGKFFFSPNENGGFNFFGIRDGFPSVEAVLRTNEGSRFLFRRPEARGPLGPLALFGKPDIFRGGNE